MQPFPSSGYIKIEDEIIEYTGTTSTTFTGLIRGSLNTTATTHADNEAVIEASFGWGMPAESTVSGANLTNWTHDNFGEDLLMNVKNGGIYYWDRTSGTTSRAVELNTLSGSTLAPTIAKQIMVSDQDRHVIAFGCDGEGLYWHTRSTTYTLWITRKSYSVADFSNEYSRRTAYIYGF